MIVPTKFEVKRVRFLILEDSPDGIMHYSFGDKGIRDTNIIMVVDSRLMIPNKRDSYVVTLTSVQVSQN